MFFLFLLLNIIVIFNDCKGKRDSDELGDVIQDQPKNPNIPPDDPQKNDKKKEFDNLKNKLTDLISDDFIKNGDKVDDIKVKKHLKAKFNIKDITENTLSLLEKILKDADILKNLQGKINNPYLLTENGIKIIEKFGKNKSFINNMDKLDEKFYADNLCKDLLEKLPDDLDLIDFKKIILSSNKSQIKTIIKNSNSKLTNQELSDLSKIFSSDIFDNKNNSKQLITNKIIKNGNLIDKLTKIIDTKVKIKLSGNEDENEIENLSALSIQENKLNEKFKNNESFKKHLNDVDKDFFVNYLNDELLKKLPDDLNFELYTTIMEGDDNNHIKNIIQSYDKPLTNQEIFNLNKIYKTKVIYNDTIFTKRKLTNNIIKNKEIIPKLTKIINDQIKVRLYGDEKADYLDKILEMPQKYQEDKFLFKDFNIIYNYEFHLNPTNSYVDIKKYDRITKQLKLLKKNNIPDYVITNFMDHKSEEDIKHLEKFTCRIIKAKKEVEIQNKEAKIEMSNLKFIPCVLDQDKDSINFYLDNFNQIKNINEMKKIFGINYDMITLNKPTHEEIMKIKNSGYSISDLKTHKNNLKYKIKKDKIILKGKFDLTELSGDENMWLEKKSSVLDSENLKLILEKENKITSSELEKLKYLEEKVFDLKDKLKRLDSSIDISKLSKENQYIYIDYNTSAYIYQLEIKILHNKNDIKFFKDQKKLTDDDIEKVKFLNDNIIYNRNLNNISNKDLSKLSLVNIKWYIEKSASKSIDNILGNDTSIMSNKDKPTDDDISKIKAIVENKLRKY